MTTKAEIKTRTSKTRTMITALLKHFNFLLNFNLLLIFTYLLLTYESSITLWIVLETAPQWHLGNSNHL